MAAAYARDGYVILPQLFSARECRAWKAECLRILEEVRRERAAAGQASDDATAFPGGV